MVKCVRRGCGRVDGLVYLGQFLCWFHWDQKCFREDRRIASEGLSKGELTYYFMED